MIKVHCNTFDTKRNFMQQLSPLPILHPSSHCITATSSLSSHYCYCYCYCSSSMFALSSLRRTIPSWLPATAAATQTTTSPLMVTSTQQRHRSNRSRRGLYDGRDIRFGNNVPFSMKKTRRRWNPNVSLCDLWIIIWYLVCSNITLII
jgi:hypothetical protein